MRKYINQKAGEFDSTLDEKPAAAAHLLQAAAGLTGQVVASGASWGEQGHAGADLTPGAAAVVGQAERAAFVEI